MTATLLLLSGLAHAQTIVDADITHDTAWSIQGSPYIVTQSVAIAFGTQLIIEPGVEVRVAPSAALIVDGDLDVEGHEYGPVQFLPEDPAQPWSGIQVGPTADRTTLRHARVTGASTGLTVSCAAQHIEHEIAASEFSDNQYGVTLYGCDGNVAIRESTFRDNYVAIRGVGSTFVIDRSILHDNTWGVSGHAGELTCSELYDNDVAYSGDGTIRFTAIENNRTGVRSAAAQIQWSTLQGNTFFGIEVLDSSAPALSVSDSQLLAPAGAVDLAVMRPDTIAARDSWWGSDGAALSEVQGVVDLSPPRSAPIGDLGCDADIDGDGVPNSEDACVDCDDGAVMLLRERPSVVPFDVEDALRLVATDLGVLPDALFSTRDPATASSWRHTLQSRTSYAADLAAAGAVHEASDAVWTVLERLDEHRDPTDWLVPSTEQRDLADRLIVVLDALR